MAVRKSVSELDALLLELHTLADRVAAAEAGDDVRRTKRARLTLDEITRRLSAAAEELDPILRPTSIFDPSAPNTAGRVVALTLVAQPRHPLSEIPDFYGAGVYAIYYRGDFVPYRLLSNTDHPIYIGQAAPDEASAKDAVGQGTKLSARLREHARNIRKVDSTLNISDFECRFLIVQSGFQTSAENYLINFFRPIWNAETKVCFGLGKHGDSSDTRANKRSPWDTLHPGRTWAESTVIDQKPYEQIVEQIAAHLEVNKPYKDIHEIFDRFMVDMRQVDSDRFYTAAKKDIVIEESVESTLV
ncbi:Eco29kI family restriction endonuclease [Pseudomonas gingeri]|uniref:Eco29kI family restriction endonuclease n=1 Tax=Pseudomonas gingeri TaxID=117681 RepID=A0A7Y7YJ80_9PSED|nr:Eco29kI family restriction endonuclease [Pseudomonas gingeri]NWB30481.1 Eco29kI family restriction endonuclease [Pseudomonas gingeri]NWC36751.1 Eco29kI family restriction endonuclease [Pseudomonas gingeri]